MDGWQATFGLNCRGYYRRQGVHELYVREAHGQVGATWYIDGIQGGANRNAESAKAEAEAAVRTMSRTHTAAMAAPARKAG